MCESLLREFATASSEKEDTRGGLRVAWKVSGLCHFSHEYLPQGDYVPRFLRFLGIAMDFVSIGFVIRLRYPGCCCQRNTATRLVNSARVRCVPHFINAVNAGPK
jgi:hypothetical protein